ncbi:hypothetical protein AYO44_07820 [Planctomycetaceae bacterium SCGC AG-212-F19]|nr:hypothetical protein AYO44_07820 [Planctomycetaceae bacterium SCGC AG-212-F19]
MAYEAFDEGPRPRNDAYTGLLAISFFAMLIACLLLLVDWYGYEGIDNPAKRVKNALPPVKPVAGLPADNVAKPAPPPKGEMKKDDAKPPMPKGDEKKMEGKDGKDKMDAKDGKEKMDAKNGKDKMDAKDKDKDKDKDKKDEK